MKKLFAVLMAMALVLTMGTTFAFAADAGTITITNAVDGADYNIYKMLNFAPSNAAGDKGIYTIVDGWADFFAAEPATNYFTVTTNADQTTVALKDGVTAVDQTLAKAAIAYAEAKSIAATATAKASGETVEFTGLGLGYYAIDTSLGTLCALTNTNSNFTATEKNEKPDIDKFVQEDSEMKNADEGWGKVNDADIDQVVNYKSTITVGVGATNYVMHDTMEAGLTFNPDSVVVKLADGTDVDTANYTVVYPATDGHTFDVKFDNDFIAGLAKGTKFTVYYSATLNENANIVTDGNDNTVYLSYGEDSTWETAEHKTTTYTWKIDVLKYTMDGNSKVSLAGAKFQLLDPTKKSEDYPDGTPIKFTEVAGAAVPTYKVDAEGTVTEITTDKNGKFEIVGLDEGSYKLHETEAPEGYNKLAADLDVIITSTYDEAALTATYKVNSADPATIEVENKTGGLFPETGGIGTTIFYIVGGLLMLAAFVVLVSKKRMATFA
ncbi:MAG: isopeptide-forming domain-containing fimbrial protein [Clostridia bacterium]|nr:isopeptide-forming domain-containing fimbrial protein [Clostridia bacterium]